MKKILFILLMIILVGCSNKEISRLSTPKNVRLENYILEWDSVKDAINYQVMINDVEYILTDTFLDVKSLEDGEYVVKVKAMNPKYKESLYSILFNFTYSENIRIPSNVRIEDEVLKWNKENDALVYEIHINDNTYTTTHNTYNLNSLPENEFYIISIIAIYRNTESTKSTPIIYHTFKDVYLVTDVISYDKSSDDNLEVGIDNELNIYKLLSPKTEITDFEFSNGFLVIDNLSFNDLDYGINELIAYTNKGLIDIKVDIFDKREPFIKSKSSVTYTDGKDLIFEFELYSSKIGEVTGNGLESNDYIISDNSIIIKHQYLTKKFNEEDRTNLVLGYYITTYDNITKNEKITIGYLFINKG